MNLGSEFNNPLSYLFADPKPLYGAKVEWCEDARLIWHSEEIPAYYDLPRNSWVYFRKGFELPFEVTKAKVFCFADTRYQLFVNGQYVCRGPSRSDPRWQYVDVFDIAKYLQPGKRNMIAILSQYFGYATGQTICRMPGLLLQAEFVGGDDEKLHLVSDESWKCERAVAWDRHAPRVNGCQQSIEIFDARCAIDAWNTTGFDDSNWADVWTHDVKLSPFWNFMERDFPMLEEAFTDSPTLIAQGRCQGHEEPQAGILEQFYQDTPSITFYESVESGQDICCKRAEHTTVLNFDFAEGIVGYLIFEVTASEGDWIDVVFGESLQDGTPLIHPVTNRAMSRFILRDGKQQHEVVFNWRGFRYVQLRVHHSRGDLTLHSVKARTRYYPDVQQSSFSCSDETLNTIWQLSHNTLRTCKQDGFLDSTSREQQQWMGDGRWQAVMNAWHTGDFRLHKKLILQFAQSQDFSGMTTARYPDNHHHYPPIPSFCLQWIGSVYDYWQFTQENAFVKALLPNLLNALRWFTGFENEQGLLKDVPYWPFNDWGEKPHGPGMDDERGGVVACLNIHFLEALGNVAELAKAFEHHELADALYTKAEQLSAAIKTTLWSDSLRAYTDCVVDGKQSDVYSQATQVLALLHLHEPGDSSANTILEHCFPAENLDVFVMASPYFVLPLCRALHRHNQASLALAWMKARFEPIIASGSSTVWERWQLVHQVSGKPPHISSASHAWGGGALTVFPEMIFGLEAAQPLGMVYRCDPDLGGLEWAELKLPVKNGMLEMRLSQSDAGCVLQMTIPEGTQVLIKGQSFEAGCHSRGV